MRKTSVTRFGTSAAAFAAAPGKSRTPLSHADEDRLRPAVYALSPDAPRSDRPEDPRSLTIPLAIREPEPDSIVIMLH